MTEKTIGNLCDSISEEMLSPFEEGTTFTKEDVEKFILFAVMKAYTEFSKDE